MNEQVQQLWQRYRAFPRAIQWAVAAGVGIVLFLVWDSYIRSIGEEWAIQADRIQTHVRQVRDSRSLDRQFDQMKEAIKSIGPVALPGNEKQTSEAINDTVTEIINNYRSDITNESLSRGTGDRLPKTALGGIIRAGEIGQKISAEFEFESSPETATKIIAELEKNPDIEAVSEVRISRTGNRRVAVKLKIEAWVIGRDTKKSRA